MLLFKVALSIIAGFLMGLLSNKLSVYFIIRRTGDLANNKFLNSKYTKFLYGGMNAIAWGATVWVFGFNYLVLEFMIMFTLCMMLSTVDVSIRKIPNEILLAMIAVSVIFLFVNKDLGNTVLRMWGLLVGILFFLIPTSFGKSAGAGDLKFAAVVGFSLGIIGVLKAFVFMLLPLIIYTSYLYISKKGNIKTKIALGLFMSIGFVITFVLKLIGI